MTKRILSMLLVLTMVLSIAVMGVSAATVWGGMNDYAEPTQGTGTAKDPFIIDTPQKLAWLSRMVEDATAAKAFLEEVKGETVAYEARKAFQGIYFKQTADIDLADKAFMPIGSYMSATSANRRLFAGVYDGNGFAIKNAKVSMADHADTSNGYYKNAEAATFAPPAADTNFYTTENVPGHYDALFNLSAGAIVKNVNAVNVDTGNYDGEHTATTVAGVIAGWAIEANVINCTSDTTSSATATALAAGMLARTFGSKVTTVKGCTNGAAINAGIASGIAGVIYYATDVVTDCTNNGAITGTTVSGIVPQITFTYTFADCTNNGTITSTGVVETGGLVSIGSGNLTFINCKNTGAVNSGKEAGGILGKTYAIGTFENCVNTGSVSTTNQTYSARVGGIVGSSNNVGQLKTFINCTNSGAITGANVGGIVGRLDNGYVSGCANNGTITANITGWRAGGIVGETGQAPSTIENCTNGGTVKATVNSGDSMVGGIVGNLTVGSTVSGCANLSTGFVDATSGARGAGGIVGIAYHSDGAEVELAAPVIDNCVNYGTAKGRIYAGGIVAVLKGADVTFCSNYGTAQVAGSGNNDAIGGIVGTVETSTTRINENNISYCVNNGTVTTKSGRNAGLGGILGGTMGVAGAWVSTGAVTVHFSYCFNLTDNFDMTVTGDSPNPAGSGIVGYGYDRALVGGTSTWDNCYSVDGQVSLTLKDGITTTTAAFNHAQVHSGIISNVVSAAQIAGAFGSADAFKAAVTNCNTNASVAEIEAMSVYKDIIKANDEIAAEDTIKFIGVQDSLIKGDTYDVRFVAGIDTNKYDAAGFMVKIVSAKGGSMEGAARIADTVVYTSLVGKDSTNGQTIVYNAIDYDTTYFVALSIEGINLDTYGAITFEITPFTTKDGVDSLGHTYAVSYDGDGNFVSCARQ